MSLILFGSPEHKGIDLVTAKGSKISNYQVFELSPFEKGQFNEFISGKYFAFFRSSPSPQYNCHGMSFASRRTNIDSSADIRTILKDDGYVKVELSQTLPGDFVLYVSPDDGDIAHSGTLISCEHPPDNIPQIKVLSKWGKYKEAIHDLNDSPYKNCIHEFYRLNHEKYEV